jgi:hypothetical protein
MIDRHTRQWEPPYDRLEALMTGDFSPDTHRDPFPCLPFDVICWIQRPCYEDLTALPTQTIDVDGLPKAFLADHPAWGPLLLWQEDGGCFVRRITRAAAAYLLEP